MNISGAFTAEQAAQLSGLSTRQVVYWDKTDVFSPSLSQGGDHRPYGRIYSFQDLVALRTLAKLRRRVSLEKLRSLSQWLKQHYDHPWSQLRFYVVGSNVAYDDVITGTLISTKPVRQGVLRIELEHIAAEVHSTLTRLQQERNPGEIGVISRHRYILRNEWVVAGTRIPVWMIQDLYESGFSVEAILEEYPLLTRRDVRAALEFPIQPRLQCAS